MSSSSPPPAPHYSSYVRAGDFIHTSGQLPLDDERNTPPTIEAQTRLVLEKVERLLESEGLTRKAVIKTTAFITNGDDWGAVNEVYREFFGEHKPARSIVPVASLHFGCLIEVEAIAWANAPE